MLINALESSKTLTFAFPSVVCHVVLVVCCLHKTVEKPNQILHVCTSCRHKQILFLQLEYALLGVRCINFSVKKQSSTLTFLK